MKKRRQEKGTDASVPSRILLMSALVADVDKAAYPLSLKIA